MRGQNDTGGRTAPLVEEDVRRMTAQILTGAVVGAIVAVISHLLVLKREQARWAREDRFRDHEERRQVYAKFLAAGRRIVNGDESEEALEDFRTLLDTIGLIAPEEVDEAAFDVYQLTNPDTRGALRPHDPGRYINSVMRFRDAARADLGKPRVLDNNSHEADQ